MQGGVSCIWIFLFNKLKYLPCLKSNGTNKQEE